MADAATENEPAAVGGEQASEVINSEEEGVDPRVKGELDDLNSATEDINRYEKQLEESRHSFNQLMEEATIQLNRKRKSLGSAVAKARPYFEIRQKAKKLNYAAQVAAKKYEKLIGQHSAAKEMVARAEENVMKNGGKGSVGEGPQGMDQSAMAWMETLNYATLKVMECESERQSCQAEHQRSSTAYCVCQKEVQAEFQKNKRSIKKAMPFFERHAHYYVELEKLKRNVMSLQEDVNNAKKRYRNALRSLEAISEEIHRARRQESGQVQELLREAVEGAPSPEAGPEDVRTDGVGAEASALDRALARGVGNVLASMTDLSLSCSSLGSTVTSESADLGDSRNMAGESLAAELDEAELEGSRLSACGQSSSSHSSMESVREVTQGIALTEEESKKESDTAHKVEGKNESDAAQDDEHEEQTQPTDTEQSATPELDEHARQHTDEEPLSQEPHESS